MVFLFPDSLKRNRLNKVTDGRLSHRQVIIATPISVRSHLMWPRPAGLSMEMPETH
jgi:hypothetical protein